MIKCQSKGCNVQVAPNTAKVFNFCKKHDECFKVGMQRLISAIEKDPQKFGSKLTDSIIKPLKKKAGN